MPARLIPLRPTSTPTPPLPPAALFSLRTAIRREKRRFDDAATLHERTVADRHLTALRLTVHDLAAPYLAEVAA